MFIWQRKVKHFLEKSLRQLQQNPSGATIKRHGLAEAKCLDDLLEVFLLEGQVRVNAALLAHMNNK